MERDDNGDKSNVIPIETAGKSRPGGRKSKRDPITVILGRRPSGRELKDALKVSLPVEKAKRAPAKTGRPSKYNEEVGQSLLGLMANGYTVTEAADVLEIDRGTVYRWAETNPSFASLLARAKHALAEHAFTQAAAIPRELYAKVQAGEPIDGPAVAAARLYTDSLKWYAERLNSVAYGAHSKQSIELSGTMAVASVVVDSRSLSPDAREALRFALMAANAAPIIEHEEGEGAEK
jgi:hypothetical protein